MIKKEIKRFSVKLDNGEMYECGIPCSLLTAMIENGVCSLEEAELGNAALPDACSFVSGVELSDSECEKKHVYIKISGVLAQGELFFNGKSCGILNGPFREYLFDVRDKAVVGKNSIEIRCTAPYSPKQYLNEEGERSLEYDTAECVADFAILQSPAVYVSDCAFISDVCVRQEHEGGRVSLFVSADTLGDTHDVRVVASLSAPSGKIYFGGAWGDEIKITVADPELWWPRGYGAQPMYKLTVTLYLGAEVADVYEKKIGLRTVELLKNDKSQPAMLVNGIKIFSRGASYVKQNPVCANFKKDTLDELISMAARSNMNTLTVFDENVPLSDYFYELCDNLGILVWQSITLPYIAPPAAAVFASGVTDSVRDSVKRLCLHPCIAMFFLSFAETDKSMMRLFKASIDEFRSVSLRILAPVLNENAPEVPFVANSEEVFKHDERYLFKKDANYADSTLYSMPSEYTLNSYLDGENYNLFSSESEMRTNTAECIRMLENTVKHMKLPSGMSELVYASELSAAWEVSRSVKRARSLGACESAVLRQLNDGKKTISSSFIDYYRKPKATLKLISEAFAPVTLDVVPCIEETVFTLINSSKKDFRGKLVYALYNTEGVCREKKNVEVYAESNGNLVIEKADFSRYIDKNADCHYVSYELYGENGILATGSEHFVPVKHFRFKDPEITAQISGMGKKFSIKLNSSCYAYAVKVAFDELNVNFSDNFVNLYGNTPVVINFETSEVVTLSELEGRLKIYSPYSIGR